MKTSIIIPVHNCIEYTRRCLHSIAENTHIEHEIVIVDNGSQIPYMTLDLKNLDIIRFEENMGFARAVNTGIRQSKGEYICLLNNDTIVTPDWLELLVAHIARKHTDIIAPRTNYAMGKQRYNLQTYNNECELNKHTMKLIQNHFRKYEIVNSVIGMCMVFKRELIYNIGGFDVQFGIGNFEDIDFCVRARKAGYTIGIAKDVYIHHFGGVTFKETGIDYSKLYTRNKSLFEAKHGN